jgi:hypothetical protein
LFGCKFFLPFRVSLLYFFGHNDSSLSQRTKLRKSVAPPLLPARLSAEAQQIHHSFLERPIATRPPVEYHRAIQFTGAHRA